MRDHQRQRVPGSFKSKQYFRDDGVEDESSEHISMHIQTWPARPGKPPEICIAYKPPAPSHVGKEEV